MGNVRLDVWSDLACPWCYIGKKQLEQAMAGFEHASEVEVTWHAFELDPSAPKVQGTERSFAEQLAGKFGVPTAQGQQMLDRVVRLGTGVGIDFRYDLIRPGNTFDAHRLIEWAKTQGRQGALVDRLMRGYHSEGLVIGDVDALVTAAQDAGFDAPAAREVLASGRYADEVRRDEALAGQLGVRGVPFFALGGRVGVSGAQPAEVLRAALMQAWEERAQAKPLPR